MLAFIILLVLGLTGFSHGAAIDPSKNVGIEVIVPRGQTRAEHSQSIIDYWTPERMASAIPIDNLVIDESELRYSSNFPKTERAAAVLTTSDLLPNMELTKPHVAGKVYFTVAGSRYLCSASVVNAKNRDTVVTAGHCIFDYERQVWASSWMFVPRYAAGQRPLGSFTHRYMDTKAGWMNNRDFNYDVGVVVVNPNEFGQHVQDVTGGLGITLDAPRTSRIYSFGYPVNMNSGETISNCAAVSTSPTFILGFSGLRLACGMTGGCSGGPWIQAHDVNARTGQQISVNSFLLTNQPGYLHGPYFTEDNIGSMYRECQNM